MDRLAHAVILSWGWRRRGIAFGAGAVSALAMPPFFLFPLLWITLPVLVWLIDGAVDRAPDGRIARLAPAFTAGWWFGFGYFLAGLWWIGGAFLVEAGSHGWLLPLVVIGLPALLALFWALGAAFAQLLWTEDWRRIFALAAGLGGAEWLRGHLFSGFPWNALGYALTAGEIFMQSAALFGLHALSVIAVVVFAAPAAAAPAVGEQRRHVLLPTLAIAAVAALGLFGVLRLGDAETATVPGVTVRVVQPALSQDEKWRPENKDDVLARYFELSSPDGAPLTPGTVLVWPESAFPYALTREPGTLAAIAELLPAGTALITGAYREEVPPRGATQFYNSIYVIDDDGTILSAYDKLNLVPLGEYVPAGRLLRRLGLEQLTDRGFVPGPHRRPLPLPDDGPTLLPLICYEVIFSGALLGDGARPDFLLNVTNDGWFGHTSGPPQHFHQARVRSVEEGLPMVRAANTGISAIIDAYGRSLATGRLSERTMIEAALPTAIDAPFYAQWRSLIVALSLAVCMLMAVTKNLYRASAV